MIFRQIPKIIRLTFIGLLVIFTYQSLVYGNISWSRFFLNYLKFLTFSQNIRPGGHIYDFVSVWWFLALLVQLYLAFPLLLFSFKNNIKRTFVILFTCAISAQLLYHPLLKIGIYVFGTPLGQILCFGLGIFFALHETIPKKLFLISIIILLASFFIKHLLFLSYPVIVIISLVLWAKYGYKLESNKILLFFSGISMYLYIIHGPMRFPILDLLKEINNLYFNYVAFIGYIIICSSIAYGCKFIVDKYNFLWLRKIK